MFKTIAFGLITLEAIVPAQADGLTKTLAKGTLVCQSRENLNEVVRALNLKDAKWAASVPGCGTVAEDKRVTVESYGVLSGISEVLVHGEGRPLRLFVLTEGLK